MTSKKLAQMGQKRLTGINPLIQELRSIKNGLEAGLANSLKPVPERWEDFVELCTIRSGGKMVQFQPYRYQQLLSRLMDRYNNIVAVKSRQLGTTQLVVSKHLHKASLNEAEVAISFMRNGEDASAISRRARQMLQGLQEYVQPQNDNVGLLKLKGLGELYFKNSSREGSRSYDSVLNFLFDECAFSPNIEQIYAASSPSTALVGDAVTKVVVSTPSARSGWYWGKLSENNGHLDIEEICKLVAAGELYSDDLPGWYWFVDTAGVVKVVIHWRCHPVYAQIDREHPGGYLTYRQEQDGVDLEAVLREYDLRFVDSAVSVFGADFVRASGRGQFEDYRDKDANYYIGIDTSTLGTDYCVGIVLKVKEGQYSGASQFCKKTKEREEYSRDFIANKGGTIRMRHITAKIMAVRKHG